MTTNSVFFIFFSCCCIAEFHVERVSKLLVIPERKEGKKSGSVDCQHSMNTHTPPTQRILKMVSKTLAPKRTTLFQLAMAKNGHIKLSPTALVFFVCVCAKSCIVYNFTLLRSERKKRKGVGHGESR